MGAKHKADNDSMGGTDGTAIPGGFMGKLEGRTALITGANRGIGRAIAKGFAREGGHVAVNYTSNEAAATEVVDIGCRPSCLRFAQAMKLVAMGGLEPPTPAL